MSNLDLNYTLRNSTDPDVRKPQRKMLTLECARNMDGGRTNCVSNKTRVGRGFEQGVTCGAYTCAGEVQILPSYCYLPGTSWQCFGARFNTNLTHLALDCLR